MDQPYVIDPDGLCLTVRVTPRARTSDVADVISGADGRPALSIRLAAPPVDGAANKALLTFLSERLGLPKSAVSIRSGETGRLKRISLRGDPAMLAARIAALLAVPKATS